MNAKISIVLTLWNQLSHYDSFSCMFKKKSVFWLGVLYSSSRRGTFIVKTRIIQTSNKMILIKSFYFNIQKIRFLGGYFEWFLEKMSFTKIVSKYSNLFLNICWHEKKISFLYSLSFRNCFWGSIRGFPMRWLPKSSQKYLAFKYLLTSKKLALKQLETDIMSYGLFMFCFLALNAINVIMTKKQVLVRLSLQSPSKRGGPQALGANVPSYGKSGCGLNSSVSLLCCLSAFNLVLGFLLSNCLTDLQHV